MSVCEGCGNALSAAYQCPLCQAEGKVDAGLYCGQSCFAQHWLEHRNTCHKRGVVRAKAAAPAVPHEDEAAKDAKGADKKNKGGKTMKRARESHDDVAKDDTEDKEAVVTHNMPWLPLPSRTVCTTGNNTSSTPPSIRVDPPLTLDCAHAIVSVQDNNVTTNTSNDEAVLRHTFWPAAMAAADYIARCLEANATHKEASDELRVVVVAADEQSAGGFAWAARCAGLTRHTSLYLAVNRESNTTKSDAGSVTAMFFTPARRLVIVTAAVLREMTESGSKDNDTVAQKSEYEAGIAALLGAASSRHALLLTLPGVHDVAAVKSSDKSCKVRHVAFVATKVKAAHKTASDGAAGWYNNHSKVTHTLKVAGANNPASNATVSRKKKGKAQKGKESTSDIAPNTVTLPQWESLPLKQTTVAVYRTVTEQQQQQQSESATLSSVSEEDSTLYRSLITYPRVDNDVLSDLVMGNMDNALRRLVQLHAARPGEAEDLIRNSLLCSWGAMSVAHAHHRLAYVLRYLIHHSTHGSAVVKGTNSLSEVTLRALVPLCRALPPITADTTTLSSESTQSVTPSASELRRYFNYYNTTVPNIQLQATLCHLHDAASVAILDSLAQAWGITHGITGYNALQEQHKRREKHVRRIVSRYGTRLDSRYARFLVLLMHFIYDTVGPYSLSVAELERRLMWNVTLAHDVGPLRGFLTNCGLLSDNAEQTTTKEAATSEKKTPNVLSSRLTGRAAQNAKKSNNSSKREEEVKLMSATEYSALPWQTFPRSAQRGQTIDRLRRAALEELLMAMPRQARPMYIGDVGNLIGKWSAFNAKYDGVLGVSLSEFLHSQPETFQVVGTLVTRRVSGAGPQVRVRYDAEDYHHTQDDSEEDGEGGNDSQRRREKAQDQALLTGLGKDNKKKKDKMEGLPARARKKRARKELNRARFNRNYKSVDPSARVPGYVKHAPRRVKGRGRKPNKRIVKRGNN